MDFSVTQLIIITNNGEFHSFEFCLTAISDAVLSLNFSLKAC